MKKSQTLTYYITVAFCLCAVQLFSFKFISEDMWQLIDDAVICLLLIQVFAFGIMRSGKKKLFYNEVLLLMLIPFFSAISAYVYHGQSWQETFLAARPCLLLLFYFYVRKKDLSIEKIESIIVNFGLIVSAILIIQALIYPTVYFQQQKEQDLFEEREGIVRIFIQDPLYIVFALFFLANRLFTELKIRDIALFAFCMAGIFFTGTRQVIFSSVGVLFLFFLTSLNFRSRKAYRLLFLVVAFLGVFFYSGGSKYIDKLITLTNEQQVTNNDYIRIQEANFYFNTYMPSGLAYVIGNGYQYGASKYGKEIYQLEQDQGLYRSDVGLIGALNMFGLIYLIPIGIIFYKVFRSKLVERRFYKFFFLYVILTAFTGSNYFLLPWTFTLVFLLLNNVEKLITEKEPVNEPDLLMNKPVLN